MIRETNSHVYRIAYDSHEESIIHPSRRNKLY